MSLAPGTRLGEYEIVGFIDAGGMGEVYRARDPRIGREVAIKVLPASFSSDAARVRRFEQEARAAGVLNHPNLLTIYELGTHNGSPFIVSELLDGSTLRSRLAGGPFSQERAVRYAIQIANGLAAAHAKGILHRDLKPENIFITADERVKILDFGLVKLTQPDSNDKTLPKTANGVVAGTPAYMSPEQVRGESVDARSDIFALGTILYEMLSGRQPFRGGSAVETMHAVLSADTPSLESVSPSLQRVVRHCLEKNAEGRVQSARDLAFELQTISDFAEKHTVRPRRRAWIVPAVVVVVVMAAVVWKLRPPAILGAPPPIDSLAVLPFVNATNDPKSDYLSDGVTESIINSMSQLPQLKVMSRSTMFRFKGKNADPQDVGSQLKVKAVVAGRVAQLADRLTIEAELVNVSDGTQLWGEQYTRRFSDIFAIQEEIARDISQKLRLRLTGDQQRRLTKRFTADPEAYAFYLKGRYYWSKRTGGDLETAIRYFQQAIDRDPGYALAYVGLADSTAVLPEYTEADASETRKRARAFVEKALQIDDEVGEAHATAGLLASYDWRWNAAEEQYRRAIQLDPNYATTYHWYAIHLLCMRRFDEALAATRRARELDPLSLIIQVNQAIVQWSSGRQSESMATFRSGLQTDPAYAGLHLWLGHYLVSTGDLREGMAELSRSDELFHGRSKDARAALAYAYVQAGELQKAKTIAMELERDFRARRCPPFFVALAYAGFDEKRAVDWLRQALADHDQYLRFMNVNPELVRIRRSVQGQEILRAMGLPAG
ncbi:MAG TPA: protein kinase [Thermoanaerobaculia bacterium]|nr:protein kinase [Thermoanaerobaculia bacterium]